MLASGWPLYKEIGITIWKDVEGHFNKNVDTSKEIPLFKFLLNHWQGKSCS